jgi:hypothetical protein
LGGSNISGIYAGNGNYNYYKFTYTYNGTSSFMNVSFLTTSPSLTARSAAVSADNTRLILLG